MRLYIQIKDGKPFGHPITEDNLLAAFPGIDLNNLPSSFATFHKHDMPDIGPYEIYKNSEYVLSNGVVEEVHYVESMTPEQKSLKQQETIETWAMRPGWSSWVFDETTCTFKPPIPVPDDGNKYRWDEPTTRWIMT